MVSSTVVWLDRDVDAEIVPLRLSPGRILQRAAVSSLFYVGILAVIAPLGLVARRKERERAMQEVLSQATITLRLMAGEQPVTVAATEYQNSHDEGEFCLRYFFRFLGV